MNGPTIAPDGPWSLGVLVGLPAAVAIVAGLGYVAYRLFKYARTAQWDSTEAKVAGWGAGLTAVGLLALFLSPVGFYPYSAEYHQWRDVTGTVERIDKRLISNGNGMEDKFVIRFGDGQQFACDDTRCAQVDAGDELSLSCKRAWQYTGTDGYDCRFVGTEAAR